MTGDKASAATEQHKINKKIVRQWQHTSKLLAEIRAEELKNLIYDPELVNSMLELGLLHARPRTTSGLVEMQRYFRKWHNRHR